MFKSGADRIGRHRLQPETADRFLYCAQLYKVPKDQLPFPARVTGIDELVNVFPLHKALEHVEARFRLFDRPQVKFVRNYG